MTGRMRAAFFGATVALAVGGMFVSGMPPLEAAAAKDSKAVAARKKLMKGNAKSMKALNAAVKSGEFAKAVLYASEVGEFALGISEAFGKKDLTGKTTALAKIWDEKAKFDKIASKMLEDSQAVIEAARAKDKAKVAASVKVLGSNCASCHKAYRVRKKRG